MKKTIMVVICAMLMACESRTNVVYYEGTEEVKAALYGTSWEREKIMITDTKMTKEEVEDIARAMQIPERSMKLGELQLLTIYVTVKQSGKKTIGIPDEKYGIDSCYMVVSAHKGNLEVNTKLEQMIYEDHVRGTVNQQTNPYEKVIECRTNENEKKEGRK